MVTIHAELTQALEEILKGIGVASPRIVLEHPDFSHGDYTTNVAMAYSRISKKSLLCWLKK